MSGIELKEVSADELRAIIADMRDEAECNRQQSRAAGRNHKLALVYAAEAIVVEHWAIRLESLIV